MKHLLVILLFLFLGCSNKNISSQTSINNKTSEVNNVSKNQNLINPFSKKAYLKNDNIYSYKILNFDTIIRYHRNFNYQTNEEITLSNPEINADVIMDSLPYPFDEEELEEKLLEIFKLEKVDCISLYRDSISIFLSILSSDYAGNMLVERHGYIGHFCKDDLIYKHLSLFQ